MHTVVYLVAACLIIPSSYSLIIGAGGRLPVGAQSLKVRELVKLGNSPKLGKTSSSTETGAIKRIQPFDFTTLIVACRELNNTIVPSKVENTVQPDSHHLLIGLRTSATASAWLEFSWEQDSARCLLGDAPMRRTDLTKGDERTLQQSFSLSRTLRSLLAGLFLVNISLPVRFERVAKFEFAKLPSPSQNDNNAPSYHLYFEVMSARSNLILVDAKTNLVMGAAYQVSPARSKRPIQAGSQYALPPPRAHAKIPESIDMSAGLVGCSVEEADKSDAELRWRTAVEVSSASSRLLEGALVQTFAGVSPSLARQMVGAALEKLQVENSVEAESSGTTVGQASPALWGALFREWRHWLQVVDPSPGSDACTASPHLLTTSEGGHTKAGEVIGYSAVDFGEYGDDSVKRSMALDGLLGVLRVYYKENQRSSEFFELRSRAFQRVQTLCTRLERRVGSFEEALAEVTGKEAGVEALSGRADLLTAYAHKWTPGNEHLEVQDFETDETTSLLLARIPVRYDDSNSQLAIDDRKTTTYTRVQPPVEEARDLYKRAAKLRRRTRIVEPLLTAAQVQLDVALGALEDLNLLDTCKSPEDLAALREICHDYLTSVAPLDEVQQMMKQKKDTKQRKGAVSKKKEASNGNKLAKKSSPLDGLISIYLKSSESGDEIQQVGPSDDSEESYHILAGRNSRQNDRITFDVSKSTDVWFHARGVPGSHVLLRLDSKGGNKNDASGDENEDISPKRSGKRKHVERHLGSGSRGRGVASSSSSGNFRNVPSAVLQACCDIASHLSKSRGERSVDVSITTPQHLSRPRGPRPAGAVSIAKELEVRSGNPTKGSALVKE